MTASRNKASRAVTAALVGVLSVGAVPMVAVAAESGGAVTLASDSANIAGGTVSYESGAAGDTFTYTGGGLGLVPTTLSPVAGDDVELSILPSNPEKRTDDVYYYYYVPVEEGVTVSDDGTVSTSDVTGKSNAIYSLPTEVGTYAVVVGQWHESSSSDYGTWTYVSTSDTFAIVGQSLGDAYLCDGEDASDTTFNYDGTVGSTTVGKILDRIGVALDGYVLEEDEDYDLQLWGVASTSKMDDGVEISIGKTYIVKVIGKGAYEGQTEEREFTLGKLDLSTSVVLGKAISINYPSATIFFGDAVASINGIDASELNYYGLNPSINGTRDNLTVEFVCDPDGSQTIDTTKKGAYTYRLVASDDNTNVEGSCEFKVYYCDYEASVDFSACGTKDEDGDYDYVVDLSADDVDYFDASKVSVTYNSGETVPASGYTVTVYDSDGNEVTDMTQPGAYMVVVSVEYWNDDDEFVSGSDVCTVLVSYGELSQASNVYLTFDGVNVATSTEAAGVSPTYDGTDQLDKMSVKVVAGSKTLVEGTDYTVTVTNEDGEEVDEAVDAGAYTVTVTGVTYEGTAEFTIFVDQLELASASVTNAFADKTDVTGSTYYFVYTGEAIEPEYAFYDKAGNGWALDSDDYEVTYTKDGEEADLLDEGVYTVTVNVSSTNFTGTITLTPTITVTAEDVYADVSTDMNLASEIYKARDLGYMTGYAGGFIFGYYNNLSRADAVMVLWNMAGNPISPTEGSYGNHSFYLPYEDCDESAYYAQALQWATNAGIVSGDNNDLTYFRPTESVTREEFAKMLYVYEQAQRNTYEVDADDILSAYTDADSVSEWAEQYVAWLVDQGVMGQNTETINGNGDIIRAEVAAMVVRMQPDGKINWSDFIA